MASPEALALVEEPLLKEILARVDDPELAERMVNLHPGGSSVPTSGKLTAEFASTRHFGE